MNIGLARENPTIERRVPLTPAAVQTFIRAGHTVYFEKGAGEGARFDDRDYLEVGANIVYSKEEVYGRSNLLLKISPPTVEDLERLNQGEIVMSALTLAVAGKRVVEELLKKEITSIGYELIEGKDGSLPVLKSISEMVGQLAIPIAARYLESSNEGRGLLLGGAAGVPPAAVVILGAGVVGSEAARIATALGAQVIVIDKDAEPLRKVLEVCDHRITTAIATEFNIDRGVQFADVLICAVMSKAERTPHLVTEQMVKKMKRGAVIVDISIDQGGCVETSRPTTHQDPVFVYNHVIHYCVPNIAASVARSATFGLAVALFPFVREITDLGITEALKRNSGLAAGVCTHKGVCTNSRIASLYQLPTQPIDKVI